MSGVFSMVLLLMLFSNYKGSGFSTPRSGLINEIACRKRTLGLHKANRTIRLRLCRSNCRGGSPVSIFMKRSNAFSTLLFSNRCHLAAESKGKP